MATRLYVQNAAAQYTPATKRGAWNTTASSVTKKMGLDKAGAAATVAIAEAVTTNPYDVLLATFVSPPLPKDVAFTTSDTVEWILGILESASTADFFWHIHIFVTQGDSDTVRGTLLSDSIGATEFPVTATGRGEGTKTLAAVNALAGDRIVVEVGYRSTNSTSTSRTATLNYGNTGSTDLTSGNTSVTTRPGWIEFSNDLFKAEYFQDNFDDNSISSRWVNSFGSNISEASQQLQITANTTLGYFNLDTADYYDLRSSYLMSQLTDAGNQALVSWEVYPVMITLDGNNQVQWMVNNGTVYARKKVAGASSTIGSTFVYNSAVHKFFRIRESGGTTFWDYSTDGVNWTNHTSQANAFTMSVVKLTIIGGTWQNEGVTTTMKVDNFNVVISGNSYTQTLSDTVTLTDSILRQARKALIETITHTDTFARLSTFLRSLTETVTHTDSIIKQISKPLSETVTHTDSISISHLFISLFTETVSLTDSLIRQGQKVLSETLSLTDATLKSLARTFAEVTTYTDTFIKQARKTFDEAVTYTDSLIRQTGKSLLETITHIDTFIKAASLFRTFTETVTHSDTLIRQGQRVLSEVVSFTDTVLKLPAKVFSEALSLTDSLLKQGAKLLSETTTLTDSLISTKLFGRNLSEVVTLTDTFSKIYAKVLTETITFTDRIRQYLNGVLVFYYDKYVGQATSYLSKYSSRGTSYSDKFSSPGSSYSDKYSGRGSSYDDKYSGKSSSYSDKYSPFDP